MKLILTNDSDITVEMSLMECKKHFVATVIIFLRGFVCRSTSQIP